MVGTPQVFLDQGLPGGGTQDDETKESPASLGNVASLTPGWQNERQSLEREE